MKFEGIPEWVSLMVPCYNGGRFIERFIKNISEQTYSKIQLIFIDDGSEDNTYELFEKFRYLLDDKGMKWEYCYQKNQGQAAAINRALSKVKGEFCFWLDVDDLITYDHVEKKVAFLKKESEYGVVICNGIAVDEDKPENILYELPIKGKLGNIFEDILLSYVSCIPGLYMVRSEMLFKALNNKKIYPSRAGQNFQLLLPITYQYKVGYLYEQLFFYRVRKDSHAHNFNTEEDWAKRILLVEDVQKNTLLSMPLSMMYLQVLLKALKYKNLKWKIDKMIEYFDLNKQSKFASDTVKECLRYFFEKSKKKLWIWGVTEKNYKLAKLIEIYGKIEVEGFIDSNPAKVNNNYFEKKVVLSDDINADNMIVFIPLIFHKEIVLKLNEKGFCFDVNYFYPEYGILHCLEEYKNEICEEKRRV